MIATKRNARQAPAPAVIHHKVPKTFHIDKRAASIIATSPKAEVFDTKGLAAWLLVSTQFLEIARHKKYGPNYITISPKVVRYRKSDVIKWLEERTQVVNRQYSSDVEA